MHPLENPLSFTLAPDDLCHDLFVTVHAHQTRRKAVMRDPRGRRPSVEVIKDAMEDENGQFGIPLRIIGLSLPFVACAIIEPGGREAGPTILDIRKVQLCKLDENYVNALVNFTASDEQDDEDMPLFDARKDAS